MTRGPLPKQHRQRDRDEKRRAIEQVTLGAEPASSGAPTISRSAWRKLHPQTRAWWSDWISSPQASQFGATDWRRLKMVVLPLVERLNRAVEAEDDSLLVRLADQLDKQERDFGATPGARLRLRWQLRPRTDTATEAEPTEAPARPKRKSTRRDPRLALVEGGGQDAG
jgi:hypothetical protein